MKAMNKAALLLPCLLCIACSAVFETNIENRRVNIIAPPDNMRTTIATQTFWWDYIDGADNYNLQIVSPDFDYIEQLVLDVNLTLNKFPVTLNPGKYEWRVCAYNSAYTTPFTVQTLYIDSTSDLSKQQVVLTSPLQNTASGNTFQKFRWQKIYSASSYHFEIRRNLWSGELATSPLETPYDTLSMMLEEGLYAWGVKASNNTSASSFTVRELMIDITPPARPVLKEPAAGEILTSTPVHLSWQRPDNRGSAITDSVFISTDSVQFYQQIIASIHTANTGYDISPEDVGDYFWRIRSIDAAGNKSDLSEIRRFTLDTGK